MSKTTRQTLILLAILIAMLVFFTLASDKFLSMYNITNLFRQGLPNIILGCGMTFVIANGSIDLSVGGIMGMCAVVFGYLCIWGVHPALGIVIVIGLGVLVGVANTLVTERLKIPAIMATLATWIITDGIGYWLCKAIPLNDDLIKPITILNSLKFFDNKIPVAIPIAAVIVALFIFLERKTILGKYAIALGGNEQAAYFSGINVFKTRMIFFMLTGALAAFAGVWQVARLGTADPTIGSGMEFAVLAACILGGVNIKGGEGTILGTLIGTIILIVLINGMQMMGVQSFYQTVVTGIVIYLAVLMNSLGGNKRLKAPGEQTGFGIRLPFGKQSEA